MKAKLLIKYFSVLSFVLNSMVENYPCANIYLCLSKLSIIVLSHSWYHDSSSWTEGGLLWKAVRTLSKEMFISTQGPVDGGSKEKVLIIVQPVSEQEKSVMNFGTTTFRISFWNLRWSRESLSPTTAAVTNEEEQDAWSPQVIVMTPVCLPL